MRTGKWEQMASILRCEIYKSFGRKTEDEKEIVNSISPVPSVNNLSGWENKTEKAHSAVKATARGLDTHSLKCLRCVRVEVHPGRWLARPGARHGALDVSVCPSASYCKWLNRSRTMTHRGQSPEDDQRGGDNAKT